MNTAFNKCTDLEKIFNAPTFPDFKEITQSPAMKALEAHNRILESTKGATRFFDEPISTNFEGVSDLGKNLKNVTKNLGETINAVGK